MRPIIIAICILASLFPALAPNAHAQTDLPGMSSNETQDIKNIALPKPDFMELKEDLGDRVTEIIDPLTIRLEQKGLSRLVGLDIPDFSPYDQGPLAQSVLLILNDMLKGKQVRLFQTSEPDKGRTNRMNQKLYHVVIDENENWVQGVLVRLGLARVRSERSNPAMIRDLYKLEEEARAEKLGLWAFDQYKVLTPDEAESKINSFQIIEGTVTSSARQSSNIYINFGADWRTDFTITIKPSDARGFYKGNLDPLSLNGKKIRVRGWVNSYNGPTIEIDHPERLEIVE